MCINISLKFTLPCSYSCFFFKVTFLFILLTIFSSCIDVCQYVAILSTLTDCTELCSQFTVFLFSALEMKSQNVLTNFTFAVHLHDWKPLNGSHGISYLQDLLK
jgi:hypothetical protein